MAVSSFPYGSVMDFRLSVAASATNISTLVVGATCYAGVTFSTDENEYNNQGFGDDSTVDAVFVKKYIINGDNDEVWVDRTVNSGSLTHEDPGAGRKQLNTTRRYATHRTTIGVQAANVTLDFYDAATGGSLLQTITFNITAEFESGA